MAGKALWEVLDTVIMEYDDIDMDLFESEIEEKMGDGYIVASWDHEDYELCDLPNEVVEWISNNTKGKIVEDLQIQTYETMEDEVGDTGFFTVVALKTKEA